MMRRTVPAGPRADPAGRGRPRRWRPWRLWRPWLLAPWLLLAGCAPAPPAPEPLPEVMPYGPEVAARFPDPPQRFATPGFRAGRDDFTSQEELEDWLRALVAGGARGGTRLTLASAGRSGEGRDLPVLHFSRGEGRPTVLLVGQQHGDEPAGGEALLVLAQRLAAGEAPAEVLDRIDVVLLPRANPDGAALLTRVTPAGVDINRDHLLLRTPEARAQAELVRRHAPVVVVDLHEHTVVGRYLEKFDAVQRHDLLLQTAMTANLDPAIAAAGETLFLAPLRAALERAGLRHEWYYTNPTPPGDLRLNMGGPQPDTARNVHGLKHAVSLLLESRGVGIGRLHFRRRVHSHLVALESVLRQAATHAEALRRLQQQAGRDTAALACRGRSVVLAELTPTRREMLMLDPRTGADRLVSVDWGSALQLQPLRERARPCGYWLAATGSEAVRERARALGLRLQRFTAEVPLQAEAWVERRRREIERPDVRGTVSDGGRTIVLADVTTELRAAAAPVGSWYLPLDQPLAQIAFAALEPDTPNSWFAHRLLPRLDDALRVMAPPPAAALQAVD